MAYGQTVSGVPQAVASAFALQCRISDMVPVLRISALIIDVYFSDDVANNPFPSMISHFHGKCIFKPGCLDKTSDEDRWRALGQAKRGLEEEGEQHNASLGMIVARRSGLGKSRLMVKLRTP